MMMERQPCNILVVDDDAAMRDMLEVLLEDEGYAVHSVWNGQEALHQLRADPTSPCLILLDLNMPVMTGWEFRNEQQRDPSLSTIPVVVISADRSVLQQAYTIDAVDYFAKPIDLNRLLNVVERYCAPA